MRSIRWAAASLLPLFVMLGTAAAQAPKTTLKGARTTGEVVKIVPGTRGGDVKMRQWWEAKAPLLRRIPDGAAVVIEAVKPKRTGDAGNLWYQVSHAGMWGWIRDVELAEFHGAYPDLSRERREALALGRSAMGFSYWWSNARWTTTGATIWPTDNTGDCSGVCGGAVACTHTPTPAKTSEEYGADCSGFVSTIWAAGSADNDPDTNPTNHGYQTSTYAVDRRNEWATVPLAAALPGDAVVRYNAKTRAGHIVLVAAARDALGRFRTYECEGCDPGCRVRLRTIKDGNTNGWHAIRHADWPNN